MSSKYGLRSVDGHHVEIDQYLFVVSAYHDEVNGLALVNMELLMRHKRREVNKITTTYFCCKFEPLCPTYLATVLLPQINKGNGASHSTEILTPREACRPSLGVLCALLQRISKITVTGALHDRLRTGQLHVGTKAFCHGTIGAACHVYFERMRSLFDHLVRAAANVPGRFHNMEEDVMATQSQPEQAQPRSPEETLTEMILAYRMSQLIYVAACLGVADLLKDGPRSSEELAALVGAHPQALYRVLRALASNGVFTETEDRSFALTPLAAPLQTGVAGSVRGVAMMQNQEPRWRAWGELLYSVKTGKSAFEHIYGMSNWEYYAKNPDAFESFSEGMAELTRQTIPAIVTAYDFAGRGRIVDVGAGRGHLMAAILAQYPHLRGIIVELPALIESARKVLETAGVAARCELVAGDYFAAVPRGGDVYMLKSIIHGMDDTHARRVLKNCRQSMVDGGRLLVIQVIVPPGNAPARIKMSDLLHLVSGGGQERTEAEYRALFDAAGFKVVRVYPTGASFSILEGVPAQSRWT